MKKLAFLTLLMMSATTLCFAQPATTGAAQEVKKTASGKVESVTLADAATGAKAKIAIVEDNGTKMTFTVPATATLKDSDSNVITLDKIGKDKTVQVEYQVATTGGNVAKSVKLLK